MTIAGTALATTIAGSLPKPAWLAQPGTLWAPWLLPPELLAEGQRDAVLAALKAHGACALHRRSFAPVREALDLFGHA